MVKITSYFIATTAMFALATAPSANAQVTAEAHLKQASTLLAAVPDNPMPLTIKDKSKNEDAAGDIAKLKTRVMDLAAAYPPAAGSTGSDLAWKTKFSEVERTLARIIGGGTGVDPASVSATVEGVTPNPGGVVAASPVMPPTTATAGTGSTATTVTPATPGPPVAATGTVSPTGAVTPTGAVNPTGVVNSTGSVTAISDITPRAPVGADGQPISPDNVAVTEPLLGIAAAKASMVGIKELDPAIRKQLEKVRIELELFYTSQK